MDQVSYKVFLKPFAFTCMILLLIYISATQGWPSIIPTVLSVLLIFFVIVFLPFYWFKKAHERSDAIMAELGYAQPTGGFPSRKYTKISEGITIELYWRSGRLFTSPVIDLFVANPSNKAFQANSRKAEDLVQKIGPEAADLLLSKKAVGMITVDKRIGLHSGYNLQPIDKYQDWIGHLEQVILLIRKHLKENP